MEEITKISSKGQVVIPSKIREELSLEEGTRLVVARLDNFVVLKKIKVNDIKEEFKKLTKKGKKFAREKGIVNEEEVVDRIHRGRGIKSDKSSLRH